MKKLSFIAIFSGHTRMHKSVDLQYNTLVCWDSSTKRLMFKVLLFFHNFLQNPFQTLFQFVSSSFYNKIKSFECPKSMRNNEKNNAWNIRHLVDESSALASQRTSVSYCRLTDFKALRWSAECWVLLLRLLCLMVSCFQHAMHVLTLSR